MTVMNRLSQLRVFNEEEYVFLKIGMPGFVGRDLNHAGRFAVAVVHDFFRNHGILLAGGVGYNILLSMIPLFALFCVLLTHVVDEQKLLMIIAVQAAHLAPTHANLVLDTVQELMAAREMIGWVGIAALLFFSSFAFRMLEDSIAIIFHRPDVTFKRSFWVSAVLPYMFILFLGTSLFVLTLVVSLTSGVYEWVVPSGDPGLPIARLSTLALHLTSFLGTALLFAAIYKVLPVVTIGSRRALYGGLVAAVLWEGIRLLVMVYLANVSFVNVIYGSLATLIVLLLTLEAGAFVLLLGAQVIAALERNAKAGLPWFCTTA